MHPARSRWAMAMMEYLASSPAIATRSLEEARDAVRRVYGINHDLIARDDVIDMRLNAAHGRRMTLGYVTYGAETEGTVPPEEDSYLISLIFAGHNLLSRSDGARVRTPANNGCVVLSPTRAHWVRMSADAEALAMTIPRVVLEAHLADMLGRPVAEVVDFDLGLDLCTGPGRALLQSVRFLATELDRPAGLAHLPLARDHLEAYVLTTLLHAGRHQFCDALAGANDSRRLGRLAPVAEYIEAHADRELTPEILARIACVSVRSLHAAFQDQLGETPMSYVRKVRLDRVRADLLRSDPQQVGVTQIATQWGFTHLSRFARQYRDQFKELPSTTLHR
jgi:AraC-like DNA-binding protein